MGATPNAHLKIILETSCMAEITFTESYSMVVLHIRDHRGLGFSGQKITQKPASQYHPCALVALVRYN